MDLGLSMVGRLPFAQVATALGGHGVLVEPDEDLNKAIKAIGT